MWGRAVERTIVAGHPCLVYSRRPRSVSGLLLDARRWGDREYLVQGDRRLTRVGHERAVARVAADLQARGVGTGDRVLLLGFNSIEWVVAFWALQILGAVPALGNAGGATRRFGTRSGRSSPPWRSPIATSAPT